MSDPPHVDTDSKVCTLQRVSVLFRNTLCKEVTLLCMSVMKVNAGFAGGSLLYALAVVVKLS